MSVHMEERNSPRSALFSCCFCPYITAFSGVFCLHAVGSIVGFLLERLPGARVPVTHQERLLLKPLKKEHCPIIIIRGTEGLPFAKKEDN